MSMPRARPAPILVIGTGLLLLVNGLLAFTGWRQATMPMMIAPSQRDLPRLFPNTIPRDAPTAIPPEQRESEALTRPLFSSSRRPYQPPAAAPIAPIEAPTVPDLTPPDYVLAGIFIDDGHHRALLRRRTETNALWFNEGDMIDGWRLASVESGKIALEANDRRVELELYPTQTPAAQ
ncbi:hypothetical protein GFPCMMHI_04940 [Ensifer adhaerens]|nr:hypothetical protein [Ensifer adhaerens]